jgi:hypothetical protein
MNEIYGLTIIGVERRDGAIPTVISLNDMATDYRTNQSDKTTNFLPW